MEDIDGGGFVGDHERGGSNASTTSFSHLLFSETDSVLAGVDLEPQQQNQTGGSVFKTPKMLCFGDYGSLGDDQLVVFGQPKVAKSATTAATTTPQKSGVTCSDSCSASSVNNTSAKTNKRRKGPGKESVQRSNARTGTPGASQRAIKKTKAENTSSTGHAKGRKEKLGDRISTLQQLVSPFGKTDTASVLHEAMGYIRFLQEQVQVLSSPYLQFQQQHQTGGGENGGEQEVKKDLKSRGLCLVPVACTAHVANTNGADYWSPSGTTNTNITTINNININTVTASTKQQEMKNLQLV